mmetsp:Transcript_21817/g.53949  ORF Transcript_21817/g.53949 Transcript_21817/m.53949 type:complete len:382 (-) Transcript_21817:348-1493(-)
MIEQSYNCNSNSINNSINNSNNNTDNKIIENMTETFKGSATTPRISAITAPTLTIDVEGEDSQSFQTAVEVEVCGDLLSKSSSSSSSSDSNSDASSSSADSALDSDDDNSYNSASTRSSTFSIYCLLQKDGGFDDDCSSISTISHFVREKEDEEAYHNNLDDSFMYTSCTENDDDDDENDGAVDKVQKSQVEKLKTAAGKGELDENVSKDNSDFTSDDDDDYYDESYNEDEGVEFYDDEYGDDDDEEEEEILEEESPRSQTSFLCADIVFEKNKRVFSNVNSRQSHSNQMALFLKNIAETKKAVGILDDSEVGGEDEVEVFEEEVVDEVGEVDEEEFEEEYVEETERDEDDDFEYYEVPVTPINPTKRKVTKSRRLSMLSV